MRPFALWLCLALASDGVSQPASMAKSSSSPSLVADIVSAHKSLEVTFPRVQGNYVVAHQDPGVPKSMIRKGDFAMNGPCLRIVEQGTKKTTVVVKNAKYAFAVEKTSDSPAYRMRFVKPIQQLTKSELQQFQATAHPVFVAVSLADSRLCTLLESQSATVEQLSVAKGRDHVYAMELKYWPSKEPVPPDPPRFRAFLELDKNRHWCLLSSKIVFSRTVAGVANEYGNETAFEFSTAGPAWMPVKTTTTFWAKGDDTKSTRTIEIGSLSNDAPDESAFTLSAYGFEEPFGITWERPTPWWLWALGIGVFLGLVVAFILRRFPFKRPAELA